MQNRCIFLEYMRLTKDIILQIASLAKLLLTPTQVDKYQSQLSNVLDYVKHLDELDTSKVEITSSKTDINNLRDDVVESSRMLSQKEALFNAKKSIDGYFVVDAYFENR